MRKQLIFFISLFLFCHFIPCTVRAEAVKNTGAYDVYFRDEGNNTCRITEIRLKKDKGISVIKIPEKVNGKTVVSIGALPSKANSDIESKNLFGLYQLVDTESQYWNWHSKDRVQKRRSLKIKKIIIPDTVQIIEDSCFAAMKGITSVQLPKNLKTIKKGAFAHTGIKKIHLPGGLISIGQTAFLNSPLEEINIPAGLKDEVSGLVRVKWDNTKKGNGFWKRFTVSKRNPYYKIKNGMLFSKNGKILYGVVKKKKNVRVPDSVTTLYSSTFHKVPLQSLYLGAGVSEIGVNALATSTLCYIKLHPGNPYLAQTGSCLYWKKNKAIVAGKPRNGVLKISKRVRIIEKSGFSIVGRNKTKRLIIPKTVKNMKKGWRYTTLEHYDIDKIKCKVVIKKKPS